MKDKKTLLTVLVLAVGATALTFYLKSGGLYGMQKGISLIGNNQYGEPDMMYRDYGAVESEFMPSPQMLAPDYNVGETSTLSQKAIYDGDTSMMPPYYYGDDALYVEERAYQKTSTHDLVVEDVPSYLRGVKEYVLSINGRILNSGVYTAEKYNTGSLYVKVPVDKFDEATNRITENVVKVVSENVYSNDVTGQLVNTTDSLQSLIDDKSLKEAALADAKTEVEKRRYQIEIDRLDRQITAAEKNLNNVEAQVEYSSMTITAADSERYFNPSADLSIREEFLRAWTSLKGLLKVGGYFGIWVLVYSIVWLPVILVLRKLVSLLR